MAVPKRKVSKARRNSRKATWTATAPTLVVIKDGKVETYANASSIIGYIQDNE